ncbi:hypothetical protein MJO28_002745 [Puccinia striiformis f. sp. tritici]|uniref:Uncharacterized protein n=2 Tax=Puccinia striiformis TaxID=27350 RepID=A0A2S4VM99_9BASI|nr:hypothetical protein MJO28_002745 [Puccinia striiformis f. sp. tritici]POW10675.1 hypothetical protein PSTT_05867 [Puccinia striiformis]
MYCLRYFLLVLLFFPFPTAPPFLVFLFLISMTIEHRPCAYCSLLLSAILLSTCSWNLASVDVSSSSSLVNEQVSPSTDTFLSSILSFFQSADHRTTNTTTQATVKSTGFKSINANRDHQKVGVAVVEPHTRCWCYSNHGRLFEPVSSKSLKKQKNGLDLNPHHHHHHHQLISQQTTHPSHKTVESEHMGTNPNHEADDQSIGIPQRALKSIFHPFWKPLSKLSSTTTIHHHEPSPSTSTEHTSTHPSGPNLTTTSKPPQPPQIRRSSFSRTPLIYSHSILPTIQFIKPHLPLPIIHRILSIIKLNLTELGHHSLLTGHFKSMRRRLSFLKNSCDFGFVHNLVNHYQSNSPYEIKLNSLLGFRVFLGTRHGASSL